MEIQKQVPLRNVEQTIGEMFELVRKYNSDVSAYATMSPEAFYKLVRDIPYKADPRGNEFIQRPWATLVGASEWGDCDDLAMLMASYAVQNKIPYRFGIGGSKKYRGMSSGRTIIPFHHVWCELFVMGRWTPFDATYPRYQPYIHNQNYLRVKYFYPPSRDGRLIFRLRRLIFGG